MVEVNLILRKTSGSERGHKSPWDLLILNVQNGRTPWYNIRQYERVKSYFSEQIREKQNKYGSKIQDALFPEQAPEIRRLLGTLHMRTFRDSVFSVCCIFDQSFPLV